MEAGSTLPPPPEPTPTATVPLAAIVPHAHYLPLETAVGLPLELIAGYARGRAKGAATVAVAKPTPAATAVAVKHTKHGNCLHWCPSSGGRRWERRRLGEKVEEAGVRSTGGEEEWARVERVENKKGVGLGTVVFPCGSLNGPACENTPIFTCGYVKRPVCEN